MRRWRNQNAPSLVSIADDLPQHIVATGLLGVVLDVGEQDPFHRARMGQQNVISNPKVELHHIAMIAPGSAERRESIALEGAQPKQASLTVWWCFPLLLDGRGHVVPIARQRLDSYDRCGLPNAPWICSTMRMDARSHWNHQAPMGLLFLLSLWSLPVSASAPIFAGTAVRGTIDPARAEMLQGEVARALGDRGAKVVTGSSRSRAQREIDSARAVVDDKLSECRGAYADADFAAANTALDEALVAFESALIASDDDSNWDRYRSIFVERALVLLKSKDETGADAALFQLLSVEPDFEPAKGLPPELAKRFDLLRDEHHATPPALLEIKIRPAGTRIRIDGRRAGASPVAVDLPVGVHYVLAESLGRIHAEKVVLTDQGARVSARLQSQESDASAALLNGLRGVKGQADIEALADEVSDVTLAAVLLPYGEEATLLVGRVVEGKVEVVVGTRLSAKENLREQPLFELAEAALKAKTNKWLSASTAPPNLTFEWLAGTGLAEVEAPIEVPWWVWAGGGAVGLAAAGGITYGVISLVNIERQKDIGFTYQVTLKNSGDP
jgi:hypothetical protein